MDLGRSTLKTFGATMFLPNVDLMTCLETKTKKTQLIIKGVEEATTATAT